MKETKYLKRQIRKTPLKTFRRLFNQSYENTGVKKYKVSFRNILTLSLGILITRTSRLIKTAEKLYRSDINPTGCVKSLENKLSYFSSRMKKEKLQDLNKVFREGFFYEGFRQVEDYCFRYNDKLVTISDWTAYPKRARLNKKGRGMEYAGRVYDSREGGPVTGYGDFLGGLLLKDGNIFPMFRILYSNKYSLRKYHSINDLEIKEIKNLQKKLSEKILWISDAGLCKKVHIQACYKNKIDFLFRLKKDISIIDGEITSLLLSKINKIKKTYPIKWEYKENNKIQQISGVAKFIQTQTPFRSGRLKKLLSITVVYIKVPGYEEPIYLITSLKVTPENIGEMVWLYNKRCMIETFIENLKNNFGLEQFMVRRWSAIELLCNIIFGIYAVMLIILLTGKAIILVGICNLLKNRTLGLKLTLGRLIRGFGIILTPQSQVKYL